MKRTVLLNIFVAAVAILASSSVASAKSLACTTSISGTVDANVVVPDGAVCAFSSDATIKGNVSVSPNATLLISEGVTVNGNLEAGSNSVVLMAGSTLNGNYSAVSATSGIVASIFANNVSFSGGSYAVLGEVSRNVSCDPSAAGAISETFGGKNSGCTIGTLLTVLDHLVVAADNASGDGGLTCEQGLALAEVYRFAAMIAELAGKDVLAGILVGQALGVIEGACGPIVE